MLPSFARHTITRVRHSLVEDDRHNLVRGPAERLTIPGCSVQPGASGEDLTFRETTTIRYTVYVPASADIRASDQVEWNGRTYFVSGEPERWDSPTGAVSHIRIYLVDWSDYGAESEKTEVGT